MSKTVAQIFGVAPPNVYTNSKATPQKAADPVLLYGMELEIENVPNWPDLIVPGMNSVEDGSLRNNGREFLTMPSTYSVLSYTLDRFFTRAKLTAQNYSERCSVHVHANCQDLTTDQLSGLCMLYQVFERLLYGFVGEDRDKNIFCIPWDQTTLTYNIVSMLESGNMKQLKQWQKYTGLNILPLFEHGTVEFRHMPGTSDMKKIQVWLNLIGSMFAFVRKNSLEDVKKALIELNSTSQYADMAKRVFTDWNEYLLSLPNYQLALEEGVLNMKYSILEPAAKVVEPVVNEMNLDDLLQAANPLRARVNNAAQDNIAAVRARLEAEAQQMQAQAAVGNLQPQWNIGADPRAEQGFPFPQNAPARPAVRPRNPRPEQRVVINTGAVAQDTNGGFWRVQAVNNEQGGNF